MSGIDTSGVSLFKELKLAFKMKAVEARLLNSDKLGLFTHLDSLGSKSQLYMTNWNEL